MAKVYVKTDLVILYFFTLLLSVSALEIGGTFRIENLSFRPDRPQTEDNFTGYSFPMGCSIYAQHTINDHLNIKVEYVHDEVLRNYLLNSIGYQGNFFSFGVGPILGFFNTSQVFPKFGITSYFRLQWPGIIFTDILINNTIQDQLKKDGNYQQEKLAASFGFYMTNVICSLNYSVKRFVEKKSGTEISFVQRLYMFTADIFKKNIPVKIKISLGFQRQKMTYGSSTNHTLNSILIGTRADIDISASTTIMFDLLSSLYSYGSDELLGISNPGPGNYLFRFITGISIKFDNFFK